MNSSKLLAVVVVLQAVILLGQWTGGSGVAPAYGQIPDAGSQRQQILDELKGLNARMDKLTELLSSGKLQVQVATSDEGSGGKPANGR